MTVCRFITVSTFILCAHALASQETLRSERELIMDFAALEGRIERPSLNYRTLSDSTWGIEEPFRAYGPELFFSFNSALPHGENDGGLWQGRGANASLTGGARALVAGFEITLKPTVNFSQNLAFDLLPSAYSDPSGYFWGYGSGSGADAPQRFGDDPLLSFDFGDSEIRYTLRTFTVGFGSQAPWLGPGRINSIMHSNNAVPYLKADVGLRRTPLRMRGHYFGDVEARLWAGMLTESDFFDDEPDNDKNLISALAIAYTPSFLPGLTLSANRSFLSPWVPESAFAIPNLFRVNPSGGGDQDVWDQRASLGFDWILTAASFETYAEVGLNDYAPSLDGYIRYPFRSAVYTVGLRKAVNFGASAEFRGELLIEWTNMEMSQDFQFDYPATFYMHHQIAQGYTNEGQWLGAGIGTGGNSQYVGFTLYFRDLVAQVFAQRVNPDNDYMYRKTIKTGADAVDSDDKKDFRADLEIGIRVGVPVPRLGFRANAGLILVEVHNQLYDAVDWYVDRKTYSFRCELLFSYGLR